MKSKRLRLALLLVVLALTAAPSFASPSAARRNVAQGSIAAPIRADRRCRLRCSRQYRRCLRAAHGNRIRIRRCRLIHNRCLQRCG